MQISKEVIEARIAEIQASKVALENRLQALEEEKQETVNRLNSCMGNIQACQYWLAQLDAPEPSSVG